MIGTSSRVNFLRDDVQDDLITRQRMPNNISIKIDTTQEYIQDEVSRMCKGTLFAQLTRRPAVLFFER